MAAQLALLRSRLLLPPDSAGARSAQLEAEALRRRLLEGAAMRQVAAWLDARVQLGREVFARGVGGDQRSPRAGDVVELLRACLVALRVPELAAAYVPGRPPLWRVADATACITRLLGEGVAGDIALFLPAVPTDAPERDLRCRAALASTLVAGLEMAQEGSIDISQIPGQSVVLGRLER